MTHPKGSDSGGGEPRRIQLSRAKGWKMPANTVKVDRSTGFGNPFTVKEAKEEWGGSDFEAAAAVAMIFRDWLTMHEPERFHPALRGARVHILANLSTIRGKNLACWCKVGSPCHADILLDLANADSSPPEERG